jgi:hypothetical protein
MSREIEINIEEVVLRGFRDIDRERVSLALRTELARLLEGADRPKRLSQGGESRVLDGGSFNIGPESQPDEIGTRIARSIQGGLADD